MFEITTDAQYIHDCLTQPHVWRMSYDDNTPVMPELLFIPVDERFIWIKAGEYGTFMLFKQNHWTYEVHVALNRNALGAAVSIAKDALMWGRDNLPQIKTLVAKIPAFNHRAQGLARRVGFEFHGVDRSLFTQNGIDHDMHIYILDKENTSCPRPQPPQYRQ